MTKTKAAFLLSVRALFTRSDGSRRRVYFWTFTFPKVVDDEIAFKSWNHLRVLLARHFKSTGGVPGVRVVEVHPGGHGLHFHCLICARLPVQEVRRLAIRAGFGRIHVEKASNGSAEYLAKYLGKHDDGLAPRTRRWGFLGGFKGSKVRNIVVESELADNCRRVHQVMGTWSRQLFIQVNILTVKFGHVLDWPIFAEFKSWVEVRKHLSDERLPSRIPIGPRPVFDVIKLFDSELREYVTHLIPARVDQPF